MKNHIMVQGKLLRKDKKFNHLKLSQREYIKNLINDKYTKFIKNNESKIPNKEQKLSILKDTYEEIENREIWIPFNEVKIVFLSQVQKINKKLNI